MQTSLKINAIWFLPILSVVSNFYKLGTDSTYDDQSAELLRNQVISGK